MLGFAAVNTGNNLLFLIVAGLLAFMSVTGYAGMLNIKNLALEIAPPAEIYAGNTASFTVRIHNLKPHMPSFLLFMECMDHQGRSAVIPLLKGNDRAELPIWLTIEQRGMRDLGRFRISSPFPVSFFIRHWDFKIDCSILVYPRLLADSVLAYQVSGQRKGEEFVKQRGHDGELEHITPYSGSEPLKTIHWKHSARSDELYVKQFGISAAPPVIINPDALVGNDPEERISKAAWQIKRSIATRPVGLQLGETLIKPGSGISHYRRLLSRLALYGS